MDKLYCYNNKCYLTRLTSSAYNADINKDPAKKKRALKAQIQPLTLKVIKKLVIYRILKYEF